MAARYLIPVTLALLIAGCTAEPDPTGLPGDLADDLLPGVTRTADGGMSMPWGLEACRVAVAFVPVDGAPLAPHTPEGFTLMTPEQAGLPPDPRGDAVFGVELFECESGIGLNDTVTTYGSYFWFAEPPAELKQDVDLHFIKRDVLIPDAARRDLLIANGVPARDGSAQVDFWLEPAATPWLRLGSLTFEGGESFTVTALGAAPEANFATGSFEEYTPTPHGLVRWTTNFTNDPAPLIGPALIEASSGSFAAEILGGTSALGYVMVANGSFVDGEIVLPPMVAGNATTDPAA